MHKIIYVTNLDELQRRLLNKDIANEVIFANPPFSIFSLGLLYIKSLIELGRANNPGIKLNFICDCADDAAIVHDAMKMGFKLIRFTGNKTMRAKLESIALKLDCEILE